MSGVTGIIKSSIIVSVPDSIGIYTEYIIEFLNFTHGKTYIDTKAYAEDLYSEIIEYYKEVNHYLELLRIVKRCEYKEVFGYSCMYEKELFTSWLKRENEYSEYSAKYLNILDLNITDVIIYNKSYVGELDIPKINAKMNRIIESAKNTVVEDVTAETERALRNK